MDPAELLTVLTVLLHGPRRAINCPRCSAAFDPAELSTVLTMVGSHCSAAWTALKTSGQRAAYLTKTRKKYYLPEIPKETAWLENY